MAITSYAELQTAIGNWSERTNLSSRFPEYITLAEARINGRLRVRDMETRSTIAVSGGEYALPSDYRGWRRVTVLSSPRQQVTYIEPDKAEEWYPDRASGTPAHFTVETSKIIVFPSTTSSIQLVYYASIPALASNDPNWLLTKWPNIYLYGALFELWSYAGEDAGEATKYAALFEKAIADAEVSDRRERFARGAARITGPTP